MVVEYRERVAASLAQGKVALEVHLPQFTGFLVLEALPHLMLDTLLIADTLMAVKDSSDRGRRRQTLMAPVLKLSSDLTSSPGGMSVSDPQDGLLHLLMPCAKANDAGE